MPSVEHCDIKSGKETNPTSVETQTSLCLCFHSVCVTENTVVFVWQKTGSKSNLVDLESISWLLLYLAPIAFGPLAKLAVEVGATSCTPARWWQQIKGQMTTANRIKCNLVIHNLNTWSQMPKRRRSFEYGFIITTYAQQCKCNANNFLLYFAYWQNRMWQCIKKW